MADITRLNINGTFYDIKDEVARNLITKLQNEGYIKASDMKTYVDNAIKNIEITTEGNIGASYDEENEELIFVESDIEIPTSTSQLINDSDFVNSTFVITKIAEASLSGGEVDLSGYVTITATSHSGVSKSITLTVTNGTIR